MCSIPSEIFIAVVVVVVFFSLFFYFFYFFFFSKVIEVVILVIQPLFEGFDQQGYLQLVNFFIWVVPIFEIFKWNRLFISVSRLCTPPIMSLSCFYQYVCYQYVCLSCFYHMPVLRHLSVPMCLYLSLPFWISFVCLCSWLSCLFLYHFDLFVTHCELLFSPYESFRAFPWICTRKSLNQL